MVQTVAVSLTGTGEQLGSADLVVVGAGVVGLGHAVAAVRRGLRVIVIERDSQAVGASVRNFGHGCATPQAGDALRYAMTARAEWARLAAEARFWFRETGTVVIARHADELAVLEDFAAERGDDVVLLSPASVAERVPAGDGVVGGAWLRPDVRMYPREAIGAIAAWLASQGVIFHWKTSVLGVDDGLVHTRRGEVRASRVAVCVGHDVDYLFPRLAEQHGIRRCMLHMLHVDDPSGCTIDPAVLSGHSLLRYDGFGVSPALNAVRSRITADDPESIGAGLNLMFTQRPDGGLTIGDTHDYDADAVPFRAEERDDLVLRQTARLLGVRSLTVRERWTGVYASAPTPFLIAAPAPTVRVVSVTTGIGMTTGLGLAAEVVDELC